MEANELNTYGDILAEARRGREEALKTLAQVVAGRALLTGYSKDESIKVLSENIAAFDATIKELGWRDDA